MPDCIVEARNERTFFFFFLLHGIHKIFVSHTCVCGRLHQELSSSRLPSHLKKKRHYKGLS